LARYVVAKLALAVPLLLGVTFLLFLLGQVTPGDPVVIMLGERAPAEEVARLRSALGLDQPWYVQYVRFVAGAVQGDLGISYRSKQPVFDEVLGRFPATVELASAALLFSVTLGIGLGVIAAVKHNSAVDRLTVLLAMLGSSMPVFWSGLLLIQLFALTLAWFPVSGRGSPMHVVLPGIALGASAAALIARITRSTMLESLGQDYVRTARAKGLAEQAVLIRHALRNALIPIVTVVGLEIGALLAGAVLTETVFAWPGIGRLTVQAIGQRDFPIVQGTVLLVATVFTVTNLALDVLFVQLDPRIKYR
jgi:peptide/nickel transport system permease protein